MLLFSVISLFLGALGAWLVTHYGEYLGLLDRPNGRSSHRVITPKGGAIGILVAFGCVSCLLGLPLTVWLPACGISLLGLGADKRHLSAEFRLFGGFISAFAFLLGTKGTLLNLGNEFLVLLFMAVFIVGTTNFYNFMDGINGIAGITGIVGFSLLAFWAFRSGATSPIPVLALCMAFACLGFLPFNMPKAKVFMGDTGSLLLGFMFAQLVILLSKSVLDFLCLAAFLFLFYADELTTMTIRIKDRENLFKGHRRHLYQLLVNEYGIAHWKISVAYGIGQLLIGISVFAVRDFGVLPVLSLLTLYFGGFILVTWTVRSKLAFHREERGVEEEMVGRVESEIGSESEGEMVV